MNKRDAKKFEKLLLTERARLSEGLRSIESTTLYQPASEQFSDVTSCAEVGTDHFDRETALNIASGESTWLREVNEALQRIQKGVYGVCEECSKEIPRKRLEVFPAARYCVECQSHQERRSVR